MPLLTAGVFHLGKMPIYFCLPGKLLIYFYEKPWLQKAAGAFCFKNSGILYSVIN